MDMNHWGVSVDPASDDHSQVRSSAPAPNSPDVQTHPGGKRRTQPAEMPEQPMSSSSPGVKRDVRAAELRDEDEEGDKFQQVEGSTTVDAKEVPCESSVEDDFEVDENAEGVDEERARRDGRIRNLRRVQRTAEGCEDHSHEMGKRFQKGEKWRCRFVVRASRQDDPWQGSTLQAARPEREGWWTCMRSSFAIRSCASMQRTRTSTQRMTRKFTGGFQRQLYGRRKAAKNVNEFVVSEIVGLGLGLEQCPEQPSLFRRPRTTLIAESAWLHAHLGARLKLKPAEPMGPRSQYS